MPHDPKNFSGGVVFQPKVSVSFDLSKRDEETNGARAHTDTFGISKDFDSLLGRIHNYTHTRI